MSAHHATLVVEQSAQRHEEAENGAGRCFATWIASTWGSTSCLFIFDNLEPKDGREPTGWLVQSSRG